MKIWIDGDACPAAIRDILFRAAARTGTELAIVANRPLRVPRSGHIRAIQVPGGADVADREIAERMVAGDLVVTSDIPLAAEVVRKGGHALSFRGEMYTGDNIGGRLNMRDFMATLRASGIDTGGQSALSGRDRQNFANRLDRFLARAGGG